MLSATRADAVIADVDPDTSRSPRVDRGEDHTRTRRSSVSLYGLPCDIDAVMAIAAKNTSR
jgi:dTDP-4-amino-4,6-dideoxygalactose transaminase